MAAGDTSVPPVVAWSLVVSLLIVLVAGQAAQFAGGISARWQDSIANARAVAGEVRSALWPAQDGATPAADWFARAVAANRLVVAELRRIDDDLDHESVVGQSLRPTAQLLLSNWLGAGNEQAYCGRDGWLFYRPDVEYLTGPGFLDPGQIARRAASHEEWESDPKPDPRPAIRAFADALRKRGIALVVVPVPVKPAIHPDKLASGYAAAGTALQNPSFTLALSEFESAGALVFDPSPTLTGAGLVPGAPRYLLTDTHWRPDAMESVAGRLAEFLTERAGLPPTADPGYRVEHSSVTSLGDLRTMLNLPADAAAYPAETVRIRKVLQADGGAWRPSRQADVLVLGDSFSNIYALASLGWGESAGLVEHLSLALKRPVDRIVENDNGSFATRLRLQYEQTAGTDRLAGKRVVIYQFSARELAFGDWKVLDAQPASSF